MRRREHLPGRPTWRCRACGIAWPRSPSKLRLLGEYREDRAGLLVHLAALQVEAARELAEVVPPARLAERFTGWARARG
ncbi:flavin reductase [Micromonospora rubida]|uniref:flavin reductase n=1 Tax=Micromonospora rubida TaxID=2697657 RepID=UPI001376C039|nr:flavin reductase [Micromonospora rubida]NBE80895.1 flavin reductase [Micromonospora rubida]